MGGEIVYRGIQLCLYQRDRWALVERENETIPRPILGDRIVR